MKGSKQAIFYEFYFTKINQQNRSFFGLELHAVQIEEFLGVELLGADVGSSPIDCLNQVHQLAWVVVSQGVFAETVANLNAVFSEGGVHVVYVEEQEGGIGVFSVVLSVVVEVEAPLLDDNEDLLDEAAQEHVLDELLLVGELWLGLGDEVAVGIGHRWKSNVEIITRKLVRCRYLQQLKLMARLIQKLFLYIQPVVAPRVTTTYGYKYAWGLMPFTFFLLNYYTFLMINSDEDESLLLYDIQYVGPERVRIQPDESLCWGPISSRDRAEVEQILKQEQ